MKTIHKYPLQEGINTLTLKQGFRIVRSEYLLIEKAVYLWIEEPLAVATPECSCQFKVVKTGEPIPENYVYLDTALDTLGPEAYHVYQLPAQEKQYQLSEVLQPPRKINQAALALLRQY
ncbi:hypothetical protein H0A36_13190 [Endozoicomonas sp. SM1973]|uniref:DUF7352 domain-containing protein n=1 Tax=Spartinivicinus marinus TaxID=2994442 RepID=A0A853HZ10_9GAMM|nr:hypothetical protein [Spartinivicinus marinus]MCX4029649.1 hypothetical protein [Spartinivicinus marinus]NYZ66970.1 hypothetical protein [Spartinivicinus marinus]